MGIISASEHARYMVLVAKQMFWGMGLIGLILHYNVNTRVLMAVGVSETCFTGDISQVERWRDNCDQHFILIINTNITVCTLLNCLKTLIRL